MEKLILGIVYEAAGKLQDKHKFHEDNYALAFWARHFIAKLGGFSFCGVVPVKVTAKGGTC